jgi:hypothetical protein
VPTGTERAVTVYDHFWECLTPEERNDPEWSRNNEQVWTMFFQCQREDRLAAYDGSSDPPANNNSSGWRRWWSASGRTLAWVLGYIADGNDPPLQIPPRQLQLAAPCGNDQWAARRQSSSSRPSSSRSSSS